MRTNFFYKCKNADEDDLHSVPIQDMGNYHEYLKNQAPPLRELEASLVRQHMFGNPFKLVSKDQKNSLFGADEIDEVYEESAENSNQFQNQKQAQIQQQQQQQKRPGNKRRNIKGPLSKKINYLRNLSNSSLAGSSAGSTIGDSDIEIMDDSSSIVSGSSTVTFTTGMDETSSFEQSSTTSTEPDVANMNDFDFLQTDVEIQSTLDAANNNNNKQVSFNLMDMRQSPKPYEHQNQPRSASAISGVSSSSLSNDPTDMNLFSGTNFCDTYMEQSYIQLKIFCIEQIKKPGNEHSRLFQLIQDSQLTVKMRIFLIKELIYEAGRFKRTNLIKLLNKYSNILDKILQLNNSNNNTNNNPTPTPNSNSNINIKQ